MKLKKIIVLLIIFLITLGLSLYLLTNDLMGYAIIGFTLAVIFFISLISVTLRRTDEDSQYNYDLKQILKKYDAILVETTTIPNIEDKNIMLITNIEDMIDASIEIRKPIYYKKEDGHCIFILLDNGDACIYILKANHEEEIAIEIFIRERKKNIENLIENARDDKIKEEKRSEKMIIEELDEFEGLI